MHVPEKLVSFRVYENGDDLLGIADVTLPTLQAMSETIKGAGLAGEIDSPVIGHYSSMEVQLSWRSIYKNILKLAAPRSFNFDLRGAAQVKDSESGNIVTQHIKIVVRGVPKNLELGKFDVGVATGTTTTLEVDYIKISVDNSDVLELDKYNYICKIDGTDYLSEVREALGL